MDQHFMASQRSCATRGSRNRWVAANFSLRKLAVLLN